MTTAIGTMSLMCLSELHEVEICMLMVFGGRASVRYLGLDEVQMVRIHDEISGFLTEKGKHMLGQFPWLAKQDLLPHCDAAKRASTDGCSGPRPFSLHERNKFLFFVNYPVCGVLF